MYIAVSLVIMLCVCIPLVSITLCVWSSTCLGFSYHTSRRLKYFEAAAVLIATAEHPPSIKVSFTGGTANMSNIALRLFPTSHCSDLQYTRLGTNCILIKKVTSFFDTVRP